MIQHKLSKMLLMYCSWAKRNFFFVKWLTPLLHLRVLCANLVVLYHSWSGICTSPPINCSPRAEPWRRLRLSPSTSEKPNMLQRNSRLDECFSTTTSHCTLGTHACNSPCTRFFTLQSVTIKKKRNQSLRDYHHQDYLQFSPHYSLVLFTAEKNLCHLTWICHFPALWESCGGRNTRNGK